MSDEARERFLRSILERIPLERIVEMHVFRSIRSSQAETGVAVIAVNRESIVESPAESGETESAPQDPAPDSRLSTLDSRLEIHTAHYRWTRKGPERGKWVVEVDAQADAPLATVESVVRGVQERAGEALEAIRYSPEELVTFLAAPPWQAAR